MKVELTGLTAVPGPAERNTRQISTNGTANSQSVAGDHTTFHSNNASVRALVGEALASPAVRQDKVDALRQSISSGEYSIDANKIAEAIIADNDR